MGAIQALGRLPVNRQWFSSPRQSQPFHGLGALLFAICCRYHDNLRGNVQLARRRRLQTMAGAQAATLMHVADDKEAGRFGRSRTQANTSANITQCRRHQLLSRGVLNAEVAPTLCGAEATPMLCGRKGCFGW